MKNEFVCSVCGEQKTHESEISTGYGTNDKGEKVCFACCGEQDKQYLRENGILSGYFVEDDKGARFTNWPGTFSLPAIYVRKSWHNFAGRNGRTDFSVFFEGKEYYGRQIGHFNQCATIRAYKTK